MTTPAPPGPPAAIAARIRKVVADYTPKADQIGVSDGTYAGSLVDELLDHLKGFADELDRYQAAAADPATQKLTPPPHLDDVDPFACPHCGAPTGGSPCANPPKGSPPGTASCAELLDKAVSMAVSGPPHQKAPWIRVEQPPTVGN